jgi:hypothetical protein
MVRVYIIVTSVTIVTATTFNSINHSIGVYMATTRIKIQSYYTIISSSGSEKWFCRKYFPGKSV